MDLFVADPGVGSAVGYEHRNLIAGGKRLSAQGTVSTPRIGGPRGPAAVFAGTNSILTLPSLAYGTGESFTWACHIRTASSLAGYMPIAGLGTFTPGLYQILSAAPQWGFYFAANKPALTTLATSTWYTLVAVRDVDTARYYLNGRADGTAAMSGSTGGTADLDVGSNGSTAYFAGAMTWFGAWRRALTAAEARHLYADPWGAVFGADRTRAFTPSVTPGGSAVGGVLWSSIFRPGRSIAA